MISSPRPRRTGRSGPSSPQDVPAPRTGFRPRPGRGHRPGPPGPGPERPCRDIPSRSSGSRAAWARRPPRNSRPRFLSATYSVLKSEKNFNNHLGLALSLLRLEKGHQVAVLEMGMSAPGEIADLTRIAPPDIAVITNIHPVHLQFFGGMDGIALAKKEILDGTKPDGTAVLNGDDPLVAADRGLLDAAGGYSSAARPAAMSGLRHVRHRGYDGLSFELAYGRETAAVDLPFSTRASSRISWRPRPWPTPCPCPSEAIVRTRLSLKPLADEGDPDPARRRASGSSTTPTIRIQEPWRRP